MTQGILIDQNILYQDNISTIWMEKNGKASCTNCITHIKTSRCLFYIVDKGNSGEVWINYCPVKEMIADFFTASLADLLFKKSRNIVLEMIDKATPKYKSTHDRSTKDWLAHELAIAGEVNNQRNNDPFARLKKCVGNQLDWPRCIHTYIHTYMYVTLLHLELTRPMVSNWQYAQQRKHDRL